MACRTHSGKPIRLLTVIDEWSREWLAIKVTARLRSDDVLTTLNELMVRRGVPEYIRSDNGPDFTAKRVRDWIERIGAKTFFIEPGSFWENGYNESFNGKLRDELLNVEIFHTVRKAEVLIEEWRETYNQVRPHSSLGYRPPAPAATAVPGRLHPDAWRRPQNLRPALTYRIVKPQKSRLVYSWTVRLMAAA